MIKDRHSGWYAAAPGYWFRPKRYGFGVVPVTWQGWALSGAMVAMSALVASLAERHGPACMWLLAPILGGFLLISRARTDGDWGWHWGSE